MTRRLLEPGMLLANRYFINRTLQGGVFTNNYLAHDRRLFESACLIKELPAGNSQSIVDDFLLRANRLAGLAHPAFPTIIDYFIYDDCHYLATPVREGAPLQLRLKSLPQAFDERLVTRWGISICQALDYLHTRETPLIHCDISPQSVLIDSKDNLTLQDAGRGTFEALSDATEAADDTRGYVPAEAFANRLDARSDIYSVGALLFYLLTAEDPWENPLIIFDFQRSPRPRQLNAQLSSEMEALLVRAVEHVPDKRFASAAEFQQALSRHLEQLSKTVIPARPSASSQWQCPNCRLSIKFCSGCGYSFDPAVKAGTRPAAASLPLLSALPARLIIIDPENTNIEFSLERESNLIGRKDPSKGTFPEVNLAPFDKRGRISRMHARILQREGQFFLEDLESVNGTFITEPETIKLIPNQPYQLKDGQTVRFANISVKFINPGANNNAVSPAAVKLNGLVIDNHIIDRIAGEGAFSLVVSGIANKSETTRRAFKIARAGSSQEGFGNYNNSNPYLYPTLAYTYGSEGIYSVEPDARELLSQQYQQLAGCDDAAVVKVYKLSLDSEMPFYAMEYLKGRSLREMMRQEYQLPIEIFIELTKVLARLKSRPDAFKHNDLKPENIIVTDTGIKLIDPGYFGKLKLADGSEIHLEITTRAYNIGMHSDSELPALAIMLYETVCRQHPFKPILKYLTTGNHIERAGRGPVGDFILKLFDNIDPMLQRFQQLNPDVRNLLARLFKSLFKFNPQATAFEYFEPIDSFSKLANALEKLQRDGVKYLC